MISRDHRTRTADIESGIVRIVIIALNRLARPDARRASAFFASLPPTQVLGKVHVHGGEVFTINAAENDVIQIDSLQVDSGKPTSIVCDGRGDYGDLEVVGGPAVINVTNSVRFANCSYVGFFDSPVILNVPGKGPSIRVGRPRRSWLPIGRSLSMEPSMTWTRICPTHGSERC